MASYTVSIDPTAKAADGSCVVRLATSEPGKYITVTIKDGETIKTADPVTAAALESLSVASSPTKIVTKLASDVSKPTHDTATAVKEPIPTDPKLAVQKDTAK